jgi:hypothetical protein
LALVTLRPTKTFVKKKVGEWVVAVYLLGMSVIGISPANQKIATMHYARPLVHLRGNPNQMSEEINNYREYAESVDGVSVRGFLHQPKEQNGDCVVLTHGAGSNSNSPLLISLADAFSNSGLIVLRCDLPFRQIRPHGPPPRGSAEVDQQGLRAAVESMRRETNAPDVFGRSFLWRKASVNVSSR